MEESVRGRRWGMLEYMREAASGNEPPTPSNSEAGVEVADKVQGLIELIEKFGEDKWNRVTVKGVEEAQAQFVEFRDAFGRIIEESQSSDLAEVWMNWLNGERLKDIQTTMERVKRDAER